MCFRAVTKTRAIPELKVVAILRALSLLIIGTRQRRSNLSQAGRDYSPFGFGSRCERESRDDHGFFLFAGAGSSRSRSSNAVRAAFRSALSFFVDGFGGGGGLKALSMEAMPSSIRRSEYFPPK